MDKSKLGLIHIYTGNGKGKTTASLGLILRASGRGLKVVLGQFLKGRETGELRTLSLLPGVTVFRGKPLTKFSFQMNEQEKAEVLQSHNAFIQELADYCRKEETDLLVLDEVIGACGTHLLDESLLIDFLKVFLSLYIIALLQNPVYRNKKAQEHGNRIVDKYS